MIVASIIRAQGQTSAGDMFVALAMGLRHLRLLGNINDMCSGAWTSRKPAGPRFLLPYLVRTSNLRSFVSLLVEAMGHNEAVPTIVELAEHYETILDDSLLFAISEKQQKLVKSLRGETTQANSRSKLTVRDIGAMTGFFE
jgi:hypothetical protein